MSLLNPLRRVLQSPGRTVDALRLATDSQVLEVGCGPGFFSRDLAQRVPQGRVVLLDLQEAMVHSARGRLTTHQNTACVVADAQALPLGAQQFDVAFLATVLGEIPDKAACLRETRGVLRPGGRLAVAETRRDSDFINLTTLRTRASLCNFGLVRRHGSRWQYVAIFTPLPEVVQPQ
jgi:ubiquinone/menaquinone biosynthesis C-methylase UbiE